jgi:hypothetical protein
MLRKGKGAIKRDVRHDIRGESLDHVKELLKKMPVPASEEKA